LLPPPENDAPASIAASTPVSKSATPPCVRHADRGDDIVTCEGHVSRRPASCRKRYYDRTLIEVAVPYISGQPSIFVPAQIVFFQELPEQQLFRYGVAYLQLPKPKPGNHF
jgi:hypothetical protein